MDISQDEVEALNRNYVTRSATLQKLSDKELITHVGRRRVFTFDITDKGREVLASPPDPSLINDGSEFERVLQWTDRLEKAVKEARLKYQHMKRKSQEKDSEPSHSPISLGILIERLSAIDNDRRLKFDFGNAEPSGRTHSYRGYYEHMAMGIEYGDATVSAEVGEIYSQLTHNVGIKLKGWKGGRFLMTENTPVWAADWGESTQTAITDVHVPDHGAVVLRTSHYQW